MITKQPGFFTRGTIELPANAQVTVESLQAELASGFPTYEVYKTALLGADLVLKRSGWTGLTFKIKNKPDKTEILFGPFAPSVGVRLLMNGLIPLLILYFTSWKAIKEEFAVWVPRSRLLQSGAVAEAVRTFS